MGKCNLCHEEFKDFTVNCGNKDCPVCPVKSHICKKCRGEEQMGPGEELEERRKIANAMIDHGGSFVNALGRALQHADIYNIRKIKHTWPDYWKKYKEMM